MDIRFDDHASFHRAALGMAGGSLLFGLALHPVAHEMAPLCGGLLGIATGAALAHGRATGRFLAAAAAIAPLAIAGGAGLTVPLMVLAATLLAVGVSINGPRGLWGLGGMAAGAAAIYVGMWCALRVNVSIQAHALPDFSRHMLASLAMGLVGVLAMVPRHLQLQRDPVAAAVRHLPASLDPEVRSLCDRSVAIWETTKDKLAASDPGKQLVRDGVLKTLEVATKSNDVKVTGASDLEIASRMDELDKRIAAATDDEVKQQYTLARGALDDQRRYRAHIRQGRERLVARMHNHVTTLEKFQLAATGIEAQRASATPQVKALAELSEDVAASGEALAEIELGDAGPTQATA